MIEELTLRDDERILDLGCGDGALTARLAELVPGGLVVGIDASESMIEAARSDHKAESEFDVVFSNAALHWVVHHGRLLMNVYRALKDGAYLRWQFAADGNCANLIVVLKEVISQAEYAAHFAGFAWPWYMPSIAQYRAKLEQVPLRDKKLRSGNADRYFADADEMTAWIDQPSIVPFLDRIDAEHKQGFRDAVVRGMIRRTMGGDGRCFETFRRINVFARK
jgi:trans-aconitate methyltransferase